MLSACHILIVTIVKRLFHIWTQHLSLLGKASIHSVVSNVCFWCELSYVAADGCCSSADQWRTSNELNSPYHHIEDVTIAVMMPSWIVSTPWKHAVLCVETGQLVLFINTWLAEQVALESCSSQKFIMHFTCINIILLLNVIEDTFEELFGCCFRWLMAVPICWVILCHFSNFSAFWSYSVKCCWHIASFERHAVIWGEKSRICAIVILGRGKGK